MKIAYANSRIEKICTDAKRAKKELGYITLTPVGETISEKMFEMGIDEAELARRCDLPTETIQNLLKTEIPLTPEIAKKIETVTWMSADLLLRLDERYYRNLAFHKDHPDYPVL